MPGLRIERKPAGVSVHFRNAADPSTTQALLRPALERIAEGERLQLHAGRKLRPPVDMNKGAVLRQLAAVLRPAAIIYVGDDRTEADAFSALRAMTCTGTLAVGVRSHEVPEATFADCDLRVDGVAGVTRFLGELRDVSRSA